MNGTLTVSQIAKLDKLEAVITRGLQTFVDVGNSLCVIREEKLYLRDFDSFEAYCQSRWGWSRQRSLQLINAAELIENLPPTLAAKVETERDARALLDLKPDEQKRAIREAHKEGVPISEKAKSFSEKPVPIARNVTTTVVIDQKQNGSKNGKDEAPNLDKTDYPIPAVIQELWDRATAEFGALCAKVSVVRSEVRKVMEAADEDDPIWRRSSANSIMLALDNAYRELNAGIPFAVCPYCQGRGFKNCTACCHRGYIGKFEWTTAIPKELIAIREKGGKK